MKKNLLFFISSLFLFNSAFGIEWVSIKGKNGHEAALDIESITEKNNYYFYNLKVYTNGLDDIVVTMQSKKNSAICSRINYYKLAEYTKLKGDYENITNKMSNQLEPVDYASVAYAAYKKVKQINGADRPDIQF